MTAADIYTEPDGDPDTLANLGPLAVMAGIWVGAGEDQHPTDPVDEPTGIVDPAGHLGEHAALAQDRLDALAGELDLLRREHTADDEETVTVVGLDLLVGE